MGSEDQAARLGGRLAFYDPCVVPRAAERKAPAAVEGFDNFGAREDGWRVVYHAPSTTS